jgi:hypothetical protein
MVGLYKKLDPLFKQKKVGLVVGGHLHCYKRSSQPAGTLPYYVTAGTSGAPGSYLGFLKLTIEPKSMRVEQMLRQSAGVFKPRDVYVVPSRQNMLTSGLNMQ